MAARRRTGTETPRRSAYASALRRLARRDHSEKELRDALVQEGQPAREIADAIERLRSVRYVDDRSFAERYTRSRLRSHGHGRGRIRQGLRARGVGRDLVERALGEVAADGSEQEALDALARKYWRVHAGLAPETRLRRLWVFLLRRGFPAAAVHERLRKLWPKHGDAIEGLEMTASEETE
jgi:regulatory protein